MNTAIIAGAGPAGLTAAYELLTRTHIKPIIIEMDTQAGGLSKTIDYKGNLMDIGGHRFFSKSERIVNWWLQFLPLEAAYGSGIVPIHYQNQDAFVRATIPGPSPVQGRMLVRQRKSRIYYKHAFFDYPLQLNARSVRNFGVAKMARVAGSYLHTKIFPIQDASNLEAFFINRFGRELYSTFFKGYTEKIWGVSCKNIPADWGHQRIKDLSISRAITQSITSLFRKNKGLTQKGVSTSLIEQFLYPEKGPGQMWEAVARKIVELGGEIRFGAIAEKITVMGGNRISSVIYRELSSGKSVEIKGDYFFSTIPVKSLVAGLQNTVVPDEVKRIAGNLQYRDFIIVGMLFKKQKDQQGGLADLKDNWIYLQDQDLIAGRLQIFNNWSPYMVKDKDTIWIGLEYFCRDTDSIWQLTEQEMIQLAYSEIKKTGLILKEELLDATVIRVPKAYPSYIGSYDQFPLVQTYLDQFENLYPIGRNGMHRYNNTDHSMMTAITAVENILLNRKDRSNIWAVNMEQEFHEGE
jgi:protoporphyrinogen oxidase